VYPDTFHPAQMFLVARRLWGGCGGEAEVLSPIQLSPFPEPLQPTSGPSQSLSHALQALPDGTRKAKVHLCPNPPLTCQLIYASGSIPLDPATMQVVEGGIEAQTVSWAVASPSVREMSRPESILRAIPRGISRYRPR
jgi:hypothetical protein